MDNFLQNLDRFGFARITDIFSQDEKLTLSSIPKQIIKEQSIMYSDSSLKKPLINNEVKLYDNNNNIITFFNTINRNFIGVNEELDRLFIKLFSNEKIKLYLNEIYKQDYKLTTCLIRAANHKSKYLGLHTDNDTGFTMSVLCNNLKKNDATTVFVKRSHLFNKSLRNRVEKINPKYFKPLITIPEGDLGDINCFYNKTLHGVKQTSNENYNIVLLLAFHKNSDLNQKNFLLPEYTNYKKKFLDFFPLEVIKLFEIQPQKSKIKNILKNGRIDFFYKNKNDIFTNLKFYLFLFIANLLDFIKRVYYIMK